MKREKLLTLRDVILSNAALASTMLHPVPLLLLLVLPIVEGNEAGMWIKCCKVPLELATLHTYLGYIMMLPPGVTLAISRLDLPFGNMPS